MHDNDFSILVWIDPGKTCGFACFNNSHTLQSGQTDPYSLGLGRFQLAASLHGPRKLWLGWESFQITPKTHTMPGNTYPLEVIGMLRYIATKYKCTMLPSAPPSSRSLGGLQKLKRLNWYKKGQPHANDASCHLLAFLLSNHLLPQEMLNRAIGTTAIPSLDKGARLSS